MSGKVCIAALTMIVAASAAHGATPPADTIYRNGYIYTVDNRDRVQQALALLPTEEQFLTHAMTGLRQESEQSADAFS